MLKEDALSVQYVRECLSGPGNDAPVVIGGVVQVWYLSDAPSQQMLLSRHAGACHSSPFLEALPQHLRTPHAVCRVSWDLGVEASLDRASPSWQLPCQVRCLCSLISRPFTSTCGYHSMIQAPQSTPIMYLSLIQYWHCMRVHIDSVHAPA